MKQYDSSGIEAVTVIHLSCVDQLNKSGTHCMHFFIYIRFQNGCGLSKSSDYKKKLNVKYDQFKTTTTTKKTYLKVLSV